MRKTLLLLVLLYGLLEAAKTSNKKCKKSVNNFKKCLKSGYRPKKLEGCVSGAGQLAKKRVNKCGKLERKVVSKCGFACAVNGGWSDYGDWSECSAKCGGGTQSRTRTCNNPAPANDGADCVGESSETQACNEAACPVNGGWSDYGDWSECSAKCGGGTQTRTRRCNNPAPANDGADCVGESSETQACNEAACPDRCGYIQHSGGSCIHPLGGSAQAAAGTKIVIHPGCKEERLYYCVTPQGELKHKTSGRCIQPSSGSNSPPNNEFLVLNNCGSSAAKFQFTEGGSIQHVSSGKCWHPYGGSGSPAANTEVVLHAGCNEDRLKFTINYVD